MVADHGAVNQRAVALAQRLGVSPEESPTSQALAQDREQTLQGLSWEVPELCGQPGVRGDG